MDVIYESGAAPAALTAARLDSQMPDRAFSLLRQPWINAGVFLLICLVRLWQVVRQLHGHFSYTVDDAYIHLAMSERVAHGLYGINAGEPSSPASSLLWPLLFVPFARWHVLLYLPLLVNLLCGAGSAFLLALIVEESFGGKPHSRWSAGLLSVLLLFGLNLFGLTFLGLEHALEVLLTLACAAGLLRLADSRPVPTWSLLAAAALPSVRYEGALITAVFAGALWLSRRRVTAFVVAIAGAAPLAVFALFLHHWGLPTMPMSVLAKRALLLQEGPPHGLGYLRFVKFSLLAHLQTSDRFSVLLLLCTLGWMTLCLRRQPYARTVAAAGAVACLGHFYIGPYGWLDRYEIYCVAFGATLAIGLALRFRFVGRTAARLQTAEVVVPGGILVAAGALALVYMNAFTGIVSASAAVFDQQAQMGRFARDFYHGAVGVHDLGWVAVGRTPQQYTMDFEGLGSFEPFKEHGHMTPAEFDRLAREHQIGLAMLNPMWFAGRLPADWKPVAKLCTVPGNNSFGQVSREVMFYVTPEGNAADIAAKLAAFKPTLPPDVPFVFAPFTGDGCS